MERFFIKELPPLPYRNPIPNQATSTRESWPNIISTDFESIASRFAWVEDITRTAPGVIGVIPIVRHVGIL